MADETTKSEADETTDDQVEATADEATQETGDEAAQDEQSGEAAETAAEGTEEPAAEEEQSEEGTNEGAEDPAEDADGAKNDEAAEESESKDDEAGKDEESESEEEVDEYGGVSMDQVEAILKRNAGEGKDDDDLSITPQMRRMFDRELENTKRVEETIKGAKSNPVWLVPVFVALLIIGLIWVVAFYFTGKYPIPGIGQWNLLVGFAIMLVGFLMTMWWH